MSENELPHKDHWDTVLTEFVLGGHVVREGARSMIRHIKTMGHATTLEQVQLLSSISNFQRYVGKNLAGEPHSQNTKPRYRQHLLFTPDMEMDAKGLNFRPRNLPSSPRNKLIFFKLNSGYEDRFIQTVCHLLYTDIGEQEMSHPPIFPQSRKKKKKATGQRNYATRVVKGNRQDLLDDMNLASGGGGQCNTFSSDVSERTSFTLFSEELITSGLIQWRRHANEEDIVVMSDYSPSSGRLKPLEYVHLTALSTAPDNVQIKCTCRIYQYMQGTALRSFHLDGEENVVLHSSFTCMHCRFYRQFLHCIGNSLFSANPQSELHEKIQLTLDSYHSPLAVLGEVFTTSTTKLSVLGEDSTFSIVNVHFSYQGCFVKCQDETCQILHHIRRNVPKGFSLDNLQSRGKLCPHLKSVFLNIDVFKEIFHEFFGDPSHTETENDAETDNVTPDISEGMEVNQDDFPIRGYNPGNISFDIDSGLYGSTSYTKSEPRSDRHDPELVRCTASRMKSFCGDLVDGFYKGPLLSPSLVASDGTSLMCPCGLEFSSPDCRDNSRNVKIYARQVNMNAILYRMNDLLVNK